MKEACAALLIAGLLACNDTALGGPTGDTADTFDVSPVDFGDDTTDDHGDETGDAGMDSGMATLFDVLPEDPEPLPDPTSAACCYCVSEDGVTWSNTCEQIVGAQQCNGVYFSSCEWVGGVLDCPEVCA